MLTVEDERWLAEHHSGLSFDSGAIVGAIRVDATYNPDSNKFLILGGRKEDTVGGRRLAGEFRTAIRPRTKPAASRLPEVLVDEYGANPDRHFSNDSTACLCSPLEEYEFLEPAFDFPGFLEGLVIPFLYGQLFFNAEGRWPWHEQGHGAVGLLESYYSLGQAADPIQCLRSLAFDGQAWRRIRPLLASEVDVKGGIACFCTKRDHIRRCHPDALSGLRKLKTAIADQCTTIPPA